MQYLKSDELKKLLDVAGKHSKRDYAMIVLSWRHGLRAAEVCGLMLEDVDEENKRLIVAAKKTRRKKGIQHYEAFMPKDAAIKGGAALHTVTKMLRHRSLASLGPYVEVEQETADLAKAKAFAKF